MDQQTFTVLSFLIATGIVSAMPAQLSPQLIRSRWVTYLGYVVLAVIVITYICNEIRIHDLFIPISK